MTSTLSTTAPPPNPYPVLQTNRRLTALVWVITLAISNLPDTLWVELAGRTPLWLPVAKAVLMLLLAAAALLWQPLRPFFIAMLAFFTLNSLRSRLASSQGQGVCQSPVQEDG